MSVFKNNFLPSESQPWARQVEDKLAEVETRFRTESLNNRTRDEQLQSSYNRLDKAFQAAAITANTANIASETAIEANTAAIAAQEDAIAALEGLGELDESTSTYKINADNVTVGTLDASLVSVTNLSASNIATGTLDASIIDVTNLDASNITVGTLDASVVDVTNLDADNITVGTLSGELLNGETITGVTITGSTVRTATEDRVELSSDTNSLRFTDGETPVAHIFSASSESTEESPGIFMSYSSVPDIFADNLLYLGEDIFVLRAGTLTDSSGIRGSDGQLALGVGGTDSTLFIQASGIGSTVQLSAEDGIFVAGGVTVEEGPVNANAGLVVLNGANISGGLQVGAINSTTTSNFTTGNFSGALVRTALAGGGTTGASIDNSGRFIRTTSSQRYKADINPLELDIQDVYQLEPKTFKRVDEVEEIGDEAKVYPGFIAEDLAGTSLDKFVFYSKDEDGNDRPEGIHYAELTTALLLTIKDLNARLKVLESR
jgi:hypothetical protein